MLHGVYIVSENATAARWAPRLRGDAHLAPTCAARIAKKVVADKTGLTGIETASSHSAGRLVFGRVSLLDMHTTGINSARLHSRHRRPPPLASSLPVALTRTLAVRIDAGHYCYKRYSLSVAIHDAAPLSDRGNDHHSPEKRVASRKQVFFKGPLARLDEIDL